METSVVTREQHDEQHNEAAVGQRPGRRFGFVGLTVAVVVGLLLGYAGGWLTPQLTQPGTDSAEAGFARDMTTHHAQAVEMGLRAFDAATDGEVRQLGMDIAASQQGDIGVMQTWLRTWNVTPTRSGPPMEWMPGGPEMVSEAGLMPGMATAEEMTALHNTTGPELDIMFLELMRDHHLGGVHMADALLEVSGNDEVREVALTMKRTQQSELNTLQMLLARLQG
ncbi:DUF305 domain-containing protein [Solwaraspora sp. WMMD1047]|uniref:DUF305 domain-containing protein n=1 Tax=Solwaraspora sp. WMMD1047 TaxID=3016102 RepID=UPI002417A42C|nr:DUF305 domain-containing protein [Solwaraspora sp. WMMD1047]MDG4828772.1 DUF305 domain-containing protein [Solwaraspora sp. WMMD1047]